MPNTRGGGGGSDEKKRAKQSATQHRDDRQSDEPSRAEQAAKSGAEKAKKATEKAVEAASSKAGAIDTDRAVAEARKAARNTVTSAAESIEADVGVDKKSKSRNKKFVEEVQKTAEMAPPTNHSLETMDQSANVTEMARTSSFDGRLEAPGGIDYGGDDNVRDVPDSGSSPDDSTGDSSSGGSGDGSSPPDRLEAPGGIDYGGDDNIRDVDEQGPTGDELNDRIGGTGSPSGIEDEAPSDGLSGLEDDTDRQQGLGATDAVDDLQQQLRNNNPELYNQRDLWSIEYNQGENAVELNIDQQAYRRRQAREFEEEILANNGAGLDEDDVTIREEDGKLVAQYSDEGKQKLTRQRIKDQTGAEYVEVNTASDGSVQYTPIFGDQPDQLETPDGQHVLTTDEVETPTRGTDEWREWRADTIENQLEDESGRNLSVSVDEDGSVNVTDIEAQTHNRQNAGTGGQLGERILEDEIEAANPGVHADVGRGPTGQLEVETKAVDQDDFDWSFGLGGPEDEVEGALEGASQTITATTNDVAETVFDDGRGGSDSIIADGLRTVGLNREAKEFKKNASNSGIATALRYAGKDDTAAAFESNLSGFGKGTVKGTGAIADVPGLVETGLEGVEYGAYGTNETLEGRGREFLDESRNRGTAVASAVVEQAKQNPAESVGLLAGSFAASYGAISTASKVGKRTELATRMAIQPGEEALGRAGYAATKAAKGRKAANRYFPNKEPLLFSEEAAIRGGKRAAGAVKSKAARAAQFARTGELPATPYQNAVVDSIRAGGTRGELEVDTEAQRSGDLYHLLQARGELEFDTASGQSWGSKSTDQLRASELTDQPRASKSTERPRASESTFVAAKSEPLGSDTSSILDATLDSRRPTRGAETTSETESATESADSTETASTTPVEGDIESAVESSEPSESLQRIAGDAQGRSELAQAMQEFGVNVREFVADESGQASLAGRGRSRGTETSGEIQDDRVTPNLYQQAVDRQVKAGYEVLEGGDYDGVGRPFASETDTVRESRRRQNRAQESELNARKGRPRGRFELSLTQPQTPAETQAQREQFSQMLENGQIDLDLVRGFVGADTDTDMQEDLDIATDVDTRAKSQTDTAQQTRPDFRRNRNDLELELEFEAERETETETETEVEDEPPRPWKSKRRGGSEFSLGGGRSSGGDRGLGAGWFNEFVTAFGTGAGPREVASDFGSGAVDLTEQRQTKAQAAGGAGIEAAEATFSFDGFGVDVTGESESESDEQDGWFL
ncbi:hypothetical protein [Haladaptatus cibarius]|uniref:hypothetical protein n=1 Tax=Haladaptatus cibarius TaxID=453847 RepID=UPI000A4ACB8C|nr:hypothetical protein [Haladaptatus cibarius]